MTPTIEKLTNPATVTPTVEKLTDPHDRDTDDREAHHPATVTPTVEELTGRPAWPHSQWIRDDDLDEFDNQR